MLMHCYMLVTKGSTCIIYLNMIQSGVYRKEHNYSQTPKVAAINNYMEDPESAKITLKFEEGGLTVMIP